jgi:hypothetical protein
MADKKCFKNEIFPLDIALDIVLDIAKTFLRPPIKHKKGT